MDDLSSRLFDTNTRIEAIWPIPNGEVPGWLMEAFEYSDNLPPGLAQFVKKWKKNEKAGLLDGDSGDGREAWSELFSEMSFQRKSGFVVHASVPVYSRCGEKSASFSWGHTNVNTFFAETVDDAIQQAIDWSKGRYEKVMQS